MSLPCRSALMIETWRPRLRWIEQQSLQRKMPRFNDTQVGSEGNFFLFSPFFSTEENWSYLLLNNRRKSPLAAWILFETWH